MVNQVLIARSRASGSVHGEGTATEYTRKSLACRKITILTGMVLLAVTAHASTLLPSHKDRLFAYPKTLAEFIELYEQFS